MVRVPYDETVPRGYLSTGARQAPSAIQSQEEGSIWGAAFRQENPVVSAYEFITAPRFEDDPEFDLEGAVKKNPDVFAYSQDSFLGVRSQAEFDYQAQKVRKEIKDRQLLEASGAAGFGAAMAAGLLTPTILLPGGAVLRGAKAAEITASALSVGGWAAVGTSIDEGILLATQETRTPEESLLNIGTAAVLGGLIGAGASRLMSSTAISRFETDMATGGSPTAIQPYVPPSASSLSAAVNPDAKLVEEAGGTLAVGIDKAQTFMSPVLRNLNQDVSPTLRQVQAKLSTGGMYLEGNVKGIPSSTGGEVLALRNTHYHKLAMVKEIERDQWRSYIKSTTRGNRMTRKQFDEEVGRAIDLQAGSDIPEVQAMANAYTEHLYKPMLRELKEAGVRGFANIEDNEALGYLNRIYHLGKIRREEGDFVQILQEHLEEKLFARFTKKQEVFRERMAAKEADLEALQLTPEGAAERRAQLEADIATLPEQFPDVQEVAREIRDIRAQAKVVSREEAKALREEARMLEKENKERLKPFHKKERQLKNQFRQLTYTRSGFEARTQKILQQIDRVEEQQLNTITRAMERAHKILRKLDRAEEFTPKEIEKLKSQLENSWRIILKAQERLDKMKELPAGYEELVNSDVRPTEKISKAEDMQARREAALEEQLSKLDYLETDRLDEIRAATEEALTDLGYAANKINNKRALRLEKLKGELDKFTPEKQRELVSQLESDIRDARARFVDDLQTKYNAEVRGTSGSAEGRLLKEVPDAEFASRVSFQHHAKELARDIAAKITGEAGRIPALAMMAERGPELPRMLDIDPRREWSNGRRMEEFLERDIEKVARRYLRTTAADVELQKAFGSVNPLSRDAPFARRIKADFDAAKEAVLADPNLTKEQKDKKVTKISNQFRQAMQDLEAQIERLRFTRGVPDDPEAYTFRAAKQIMNINYMRMLGGVVISSLPDIGSAVLRHGITNTFRHGFMPMIKDFKTWKISAKEAHYAGVNLDVVLAGRSAAMFDIFDEVEHGTKFERGLQWATNNFGKAVLFDQWNAGMKSLATGLNNARMMKALQDVAEGKAKKQDITYLAANGIDGPIAKAMWNEITQTPNGGASINGVYMPNTMYWKDRNLARAYQAAIGRQADSIIVTPGLERPLWVDSNIFMRLIAQFRSFTFASMQQLLVAGAQEAKIGNMASVGQGVVSMLALGALSYYLYAMGRGGKTKERMQNASADEWALEAVKRSGLLGIMAEVQNFGENTPGLRNLATAGSSNDVRPFFGSPVSRTLGPTVDFFGQLDKVVSTAHDPSSQTVKSIRRLLPMNNVTGLSYLFNAVENLGGQVLDNQ